MEGMLNEIKTVQDTIIETTTDTLENTGAFCLYNYYYYGVL